MQAQSTVLPGDPCLAETTHASSTYIHVFFMYQTTPLIVQLSCPKASPKDLKLLSTSLCYGILVTHVYPQRNLHLRLLLSSRWPQVPCWPCDGSQQNISKYNLGRFADWHLPHAAPVMPTKQTLHKQEYPAGQTRVTHMLSLPCGVLIQSVCLVAWD